MSFPGWEDVFPRLRGERHGIHQSSIAIKNKSFDTWRHFYFPGPISPKKRAAYSRTLSPHFSGCSSRHTKNAG